MNMSLSTHEQGIKDHLIKEGTFVSQKVKGNLIIFKFLDPDHKKLNRGKYRYSINHFSVIRLKSQEVLEDKPTWKYEVWPVHGNNTKWFRTFTEVLNFIREYQSGIIHFNHVCECGASWSDEHE